MSYERPDPERGAYTPRTDDDLPFDRSGFDARDRRRGGGGGGGGRGGPPPLMLIGSVVVLLVLIVAVILYYRSGVRGEGEAPPVVGGEGVQAGAAPEDAQPLNEGADIELYDPTDEQIALAPPPEEPTALPPPLTQNPPTTPPVATTPPVQTQPRPSTPPAQTRPAPPEPRPSTPPAQTRPAPVPAPSGGASVQIGAFSSQEAAERAYAEVAANFPQFASGRTRGIQRVTTSDGRNVYRTTVNGFSAQDARAFCGALRAAGRDCLVQ